jgi:hypothetical protein
LNGSLRMLANADILKRLLLAAALRRAPMWFAALLPWAWLRTMPALAVGLILIAADGWRMWTKIRDRWTIWLDGEVAAMEDSSALLLDAGTPLARMQRTRLLARINDAVDSPAIRRIVAARVGWGWPWIVASVVLAALWFVHLTRGGDAVAAAAAAKLAAVRSEVTMHVEPPAYTGISAFDTGPRDLLVPEGSKVSWCLTKPQGEPRPIELSDGRTLRIGRGCEQELATESIFWRWEGVRYTLRVQPDEAPQIQVLAPKEMVHVLARDAKLAPIHINVNDDYQVTRATMHLTLARGTGENVRFTDREMPLPASSDPKQRGWNKQWSLAELGMEPGDELYFFIRAADNATVPHAVQSPTYTIRLPGPEAEEEETTALPSLVKPENLRSQRQIIIDTEQLVADVRANPRLERAVVRQRSEKIAGDQALLRRRFGKFLGEESSLFGEADDDDHGGSGGGQQDVLHQYGHAHDEAENATLFDEPTKKILRRALAAMWDAEKSLRAIEPKPALPPEYKALEAIKELQQADRIYLQKTAFAPPAIKEEIRMSGDVVGAASYKREQGVADQVVPQELRSLIAQLSGDAALPGLWSRTAQDWIRERIRNDEQRLAAQAAVQDVADGCVACRAVLRAWLRNAITDAPVILQAQPVVDSKLSRALGKGGRP